MPPVFMNDNISGIEYRGTGSSATFVRDRCLMRLLLSMCRSSKIL
jgi:hypothetical protein